MRDDPIAHWHQKLDEVAKELLELARLRHYGVQVVLSWRPGDRQPSAKITLYSEGIDKT